MSPLQPDALRQARRALAARDPRAEAAALRRAHGEGRLTPAQALRLLRLLQGLGEHAAAATTAEAMLRSSPAEPALILARAAALAELHRPQEAETALRRLLALRPPPPAVFDQLARLWSGHPGRTHALADAVAGVIARDGPSPAACAALGRMLMELNRAEEAETLLREAVAAGPEDAGAWRDLGIGLRHRGKAAEAAAALERAAATAPADPRILRLAGLGHHHAYGDAAWRRTSLALARHDEMLPGGQAELHRAMSKALLDVGEEDAAIAHHMRAARLQAGLLPWTGAAERAWLDVQHRAAAEGHFGTATGGSMDERPVLVVGLPRSGTTLVEQIIAAHPEADSAGEVKSLAAALDGLRLGEGTLSILRPGEHPAPALRDADRAARAAAYLGELERVTRPGAARLVDKLPGNWLWLGPLHLILPRARIIHCVRDPLDAAVSQYRHFLGPEQPWSCDFGRLARLAALHAEAMALWRRLLPAEQLLEVRLEALVAEPEAGARRICDFLGLRWDPACIAFQDTSRPVRTASALAVRGAFAADGETTRWRERPELAPLAAAIEAQRAGHIAEASAGG